MEPPTYISCGQREGNTNCDDDEIHISVHSGVYGVSDDLRILCIARDENDVFLAIEGFNFIGGGSGDDEQSILVFLGCQFLEDVISNMF